MTLRDLPLIITSACAGAAIVSIFLWPSPTTITIVVVLAAATLLQIALAARTDEPDKPAPTVRDDALRERLAKRRKDLKEKP